MKSLTQYIYEVDATSVGRDSIMVLRSCRSARFISICPGISIESMPSAGQPCLQLEISSIQIQMTIRMTTLSMRMNPSWH